ncbi:MAG TPA: hypothetical protein VFU13_21345 [Steroidobacteraceae bacterium]|nr:hypothetical protein [Steroidobacteraceae bacterium]
MRLTSKVAGIVAVGALAAAAGMYVARDGRGPPRDRTRAEAFLSTAPADAAPAARTPASPVASTPDIATPTEPAITIAELELRLEASDRDDRNRVLEAALPAMVAQNPEEIARFAELQADPQLRELLVRQVAQLWAKTDAERAMAWVTSLPDSPERVATLIDVSLTVALTDPQRAVSLREPVVGNVEPDGVLESLVQQWAQTDFDAALAWADARPRNAQRDKLLQRLVYVRAANGAPDEAARLADTAFEDGAQKVEAIASVARQWSQTDPAAANAWLAGLDDATARSVRQQLAPANPSM